VGFASCQAIRSDQVAAAGAVTAAGLVSAAGTVAPMATTVPTGAKIPADIRSAYGLNSSASGGKTVAIVDAYNAPTAEADLGVYRKQFGLAPCTTANKCFRKVSQTGSTTRLPRNDGGWAQEISLDLDMVSAACPGCKILLVEASSASFANLGAGVNYAAAQPGVVAISNSYGGSDSTATSAYNHPGIAITASTGDSGYGAQSPATFPGVVAVGGTSLTKASTTRGWSESAWSGAGSGCSTINDTTVQDKTATQCAKKADADVSAVADPNTGVAVYDSYAYQGASGWMVFGGTSASSPIVASVYALSGKTANAESLPWAAFRAGGAGLNDVTTGSNGTCPTAVWCHAGTGWDGPTGLGTPNGTSAF
jgi:subtilase family serine protease